MLAASDFKMFRFIFEGPAGPLKAFLISRYQYGRSAEWHESFYPERVLLNGRAVAEETWVSPGDEISYRHLRAEEPPAPLLPAQLYEDEWMLALHKPDSVPVSPSGVYYFTALAIHVREIFGNSELTPIHRLDLETSGVLILAKRRADLGRWHTLFAARSDAGGAPALDKRYLALALGEVDPRLNEIRGRIVPAADSAIRTRLALDPQGVPENSRTLIRRVERHAQRGAAYSELELQPFTGKTNQLRVHLAHVGHPVVGDKKYHPDERVFQDWLTHRDFERVRPALLLPRQALQCQRLEFPHPFTGRWVRIEAQPGSWRAKVAPLIEPRLADG